MSMTRRAFSTLLGGAAVAGLTSLPAAASNVTTDAKVDHANGLSGYPLRFKHGQPSAAWSAAPGETTYFALSHDAGKTFDLEMTSANGAVVHRFGRVAVNSQPWSNTTPWSHGAGYRPTVEWTIPAHTPSGVYFLNQLPNLFVVVRDLATTTPPRADRGLATALLVPTNTISAYSLTEGHDFYSKPTHANVLSFLRPFSASERADWLELLRWVETQDVFGSPRYLIDHDLEEGNALNGVKLLIIDGHSEYWSRAARLHFERFVASGGHVIVAGGNTMWWQVRYADRGEQLICYKSVDLDPIANPELITINWTDPSLGLPTDLSIGGDFRRGGYGRRAPGAGASGAGLRVLDAQHPLLRSIDAKSCDMLDLGGVSEFDGAPIKGFDALGRPVADAAALGAFRLEILAWDWGHRARDTTIGTAHVYQREELGGTVLHLGAKECCEGNRPGNVAMRAICREFAERIYREQTLFSGLTPTKVVTPLQPPWPGKAPVIHGQCG